MFQALARLVGWGDSPKPAPEPARPDPSALSPIARESVAFLRQANCALESIASNRIVEVFGVDSEGRFKSGPNRELPRNNAGHLALSVTSFIDDGSRFIFGIPADLSAQARERVSEALRFRYEKDLRGDPKRMEFFEAARGTRPGEEICGGIHLEAMTLHPKVATYTRLPVGEKAVTIDYIECGGFELNSSGNPRRSLEVIPVDDFLQRAGMTRPRELEIIPFVLCEKPSGSDVPSKSYVALPGDMAIEISGKEDPGKSLGLAPDSKLVITYTGDFQVIASFKGKDQEIALLRKDI